MFQDSNNFSDGISPRVPQSVVSAIPSRSNIKVPRSDKPQTFTRIFRWRLPAGQTREPATVEVVGTFTKWQKVPLNYDEAERVWHVTLRDIPVNRTHHYMLLVDGQPDRGERYDGMAAPRTAQEAQFALKTERGPRVLMLFAQTK